MLVTAEVKPCELKLDRQNLNFKFNDNSFDLNASEIIKLKNNGNSPVSFSFYLAEKPTFDVKPRKGIVKPNTSFNVQVI